jgi:hypothetical protein
MTAATSAPKPILVTASCATTARFVFFTESTIVCSSSGCSVRGSTTSTETPSFSERFVDEPARGDDGHVLAFAMDARLTDRDRLELLRDVLL